MHRVLRKYIIIALLALTALSMMMPWAASAQAGRTIPLVVVNNDVVNLDVPPVIRDGRTLVPVRGIFEKLGADVTWNQDAKTVTVIKGDVEIELTIGSRDAYVDGKPAQLDVPAQLVTGRTMVPLRFISESIGAKVGWDQDNYVITVEAAVPGDYHYLKTIELMMGDSEAYVNGEPVRMDQAPYLKNGRALVPFRFLGDSLGAEIKWENAARSAVFQRVGGPQVKVSVGSKTAYVDGKAVALDVPAEIKGGRTFIPLRFVSEAMGAEVNWDSDFETAEIIFVDETGWLETNEPVSGKTLRYPADWTVESGVYTTIYTPLGSKVIFNSVSEDPSTVIAAKIETYKNAGFEEASSEPLDPNDLAKGNIVAYIKIDEENLEDSDMFVFLAARENNTTLVFELATKLGDASKDLPVFDRVFADIE